METNNNRIAQNTDSQNKAHLSKIKTSRIFYPIAIGLAVVGYMIWDEFDIEAFSQLHFDVKSLFWLLMAILCMFGRDIGYIIRIKVLSGGELSWLEAFRIIMLWEFTSAITPSAIGGTSFAIIYVHKEGLSVGKSSAIVLLTSFLDELYFVVMFPLLVMIVGGDRLFGEVHEVGLSVESGILAIALTGYILKLSYCILISYGLFINSKGFKILLFNIFKLKFLRKYHRKAIKVGDDIETASRGIKNKGLKFWAKAISSTFLSWSSRYLVVNCILLAFFAGGDQILLFARQLIMWIMMLIMPTPGGSGFAEFLFKEYLGQFIPIASLAVIMALLWRLVTYYPYLIAGAIMFPRWIKSKFGKK
ncbi:MAG: lysylphosphatidylglycerol synthase transmembrane domain-containing protein [Rikenellaceae bacterium]